MLNLKHKEIMNIVQGELSSSAHNLDHVMRVYNLSLLLAEHEDKVNLNILIPAALLHDIARVKESEDKSGRTDHAVLGSIVSEEILKSLKYNEIDIEKIKHCILTHRFRTGNEPKTIEAKILFDADKLDALGAMGVARCFMLAGHFGQSLVSKPSKDCMSENTTDNGRLKDASIHTPFIEYEVKFKKIPDKLYTKKAKEIGKNKLKFMTEFFDRLSMEVQSKDMDLYK